jgi:hypothetical protein
LAAELELASAELPETTFRLGHGPNPWEWPDWAYAKPDGTFGNRWDDPDSVYRVLYACSQRLGTFIETLARFRPDPVVAAALDAIDDNDPTAPTSLAPGQVPRSWLVTRRIGRAIVSGRFADVGHSTSLAALRLEMAARLVHYDIPDLDASAIRRAVPRRLTQEISRRIFELSDAGRRRFAGIVYRSRLGDEFQNCAIFEPADLQSSIPENVLETDADLMTALGRLGLELVDG